MNLGKLQEIKSGGMGKAYMYPNYVIKMTSDQIEANIALMTTKFEEFPAISVKKKGTLYRIFQHRVQMVPNDIKRSADKVMAILDKNPDFIQTGLKTKEYIDTSMIKVMNSIVSLYEKTGFLHDDAGPTNIGFFRNQYVFFDLGPLRNGITKSNEEMFEAVSEHLYKAK